MSATTWLTAPIVMIMLLVTDNKQQYDQITQDITRHTKFQTLIVIKDQDTSTRVFLHNYPTLHNTDARKQQHTRSAGK
jgi:hypothetical protein